jgi:FkbM family methyltransferase
MIHLRIAGGLTLAVPDRLDSITTYVLLEQETWFEKETVFLPRYLRPGMTAIDIGANLGVYSLLMASLVGAEGHVFAFEPASEPRALLERSRALNQAKNLEISASALSDNEREGHLVLGNSSELNALGDGGIGERVHVTSLDFETASHNWPAPDFIKIDAEGEEERILRGASKTLTRHSPVVMFEIKAGNRVNETLRAAFPALGYGLFRLLPSAVLVPVRPQDPLDDYELNLFAAKPDRARALSQQNLLVEEVPSCSPGDNERSALSTFGVRAEVLDPIYCDSLAAYSRWRAVDESAPVRCAALGHSFRLLKQLCADSPTPSRLSTFVRVGWEWGARRESVAAAQALLQILQRGPVELTEPFWPACPGYDHVAYSQRVGDWFSAAVAEQFERSYHFSSVFSGPSPVLDWLCNQSIASTEMLRRRTLVAARTGHRPRVPERLCIPAADHLNADNWRLGKVPGTTHGP